MMSDVTEEELQAEEESKRKYEDFVKCFRKYIPQGKEHVSESEIKTMNSNKIKEIKKLIGEKNNCILLVFDACYKNAESASKLILTENYTESVYTTMLRLTTYIVLCRLAENIRGSLKTVQKHGLIFKVVPYSKSNPFFTGETDVIHKIISICVWTCLAQWCRKRTAGKMRAITNTVDHEFGHYLAAIKNIKANERLSHESVMRVTPAKTELELNLGRNSIFVRNKDIKDILDQISSHLNDIVKDKKDEPEKKQFVSLLQESIAQCSAKIETTIGVMRDSVSFFCEREAFRKMYGMVVKLKNGKKPTEGASKYVESFNKVEAEPGNLLTAQGRGWAEELYAEARAKSKDRIYDEIEQDLSVKLGCFLDWNDLLDIANYMGDDGQKQRDAKLAGEYVRKLTKGKNIWGLAYRLLNMDKFKVHGLSEFIEHERKRSEKVIAEFVRRADRHTKALLGRVKDYVCKHKDIHSLLSDSNVKNELANISGPDWCDEQYLDFYAKSMGYK